MPRGKRNARAVSNAPMTTLAVALTSADARAPLAAPCRSEELAWQASLSEVLVEQQPMLRRLVHRLLAWPGAAAEVDDVVQEALLAAWSRRSGFRGESSVSTWLTRIALNKARNHMRWARLRRRQVRHDDPASEPADPDTASSPAEHREGTDAVHAALASLPHADREILVLHYLEQRSVSEVADLLGLRRPATDTRLHRARARLRKLLAAAEGEP